jgi:hypothetical protein
LKEEKKEKGKTANKEWLEGKKQIKNEMSGFLVSRAVRVPRLRTGETALQMWKVAAVVLNKQMHTAENLGYLAWGLGVGD